MPFLGFLGGMWGKLLAVLAIVAMALATVSKLMNAGAARERSRQLEAAARGAEVRRRIEEDVSRETDADLDDALRPPDQRGRLRD